MQHVTCLGLGQPGTGSCFDCTGAVVFVQHPSALPSNHLLCPAHTCRKRCRSSAARWPSRADWRGVQFWTEAVSWRGDLRQGGATTGRNLEKGHNTRAPQVILRLHRWISVGQSGHAALAALAKQHPPCLSTAWHGLESRLTAADRGRSRRCKSPPPLHLRRHACVRGHTPQSRPGC